MMRYFHFFVKAIFAISILFSESACSAGDSKNVCDRGEEFVIDSAGTYSLNREFVLGGAKIRPMEMPALVAYVDISIPSDNFKFEEAVKLSLMANLKGNNNLRCSESDEFPLICSQGIDGYNLQISLFLNKKNGEKMAEKMKYLTNYVKSRVICKKSSNWN